MKKSPPLTLTQKAVRALHEAVAKVVEDHRRQGRPLAVWRDGQAVWQPTTATAGAVVQESPAPYAKKHAASR